MIIKLRKKPVEVEAVQFAGNNHTEIIDFANTASFEEMASGGRELVIGTLEGRMAVSIGDWVIKGVKGEFYPCKPDVKELTYDEVD